MHRAEVFFLQKIKAYLHHTCGFSEKDDTNTNRLLMITTVLGS
jgi:hypothetical protein